MGKTKRRYEGFAMHHKFYYAAYENNSFKVFQTNKQLSLKDQIKRNVIGGPFTNEHDANELCEHYEIGKIV